MSLPALPIRPGSHAHRLLALAGAEATPLDVLASTLGVRPDKASQEARLLTSHGLLSVCGRRGVRTRPQSSRAYARTPEGERVLALLGPVA